ncbi:MAG: hypothetical protein AAF539_11450 [Planctomycetota bacterium]
MPKKSHSTTPNQYRLSTNGERRIVLGLRMMITSTLWTPLPGTTSVAEEKQALPSPVTKLIGDPALNGSARGIVYCGGHAAEGKRSCAARRKIDYETAFK